jgi:hypothetical protein
MKKPGGGPPNPQLIKLTEKQRTEGPLFEIPPEARIGLIEIPAGLRTVVDVVSAINAGGGSARVGAEAVVLAPPVVSTGRPAHDAEYLALAQRYNLPVERLVDGVRYCRHHPEEKIQFEARPCALCRKEGSS